jgi:hypothetical protein
MNKKAVIVIIVIVVVILLAISSWLVYKKFIKKPEDEGTDGDYNLPPINYPGGAPSAYTTPISFPIKRGMNGDSVIQIQNAINKKCNAGLTPDGAFGPKTESALSSCYKTTSVTEALLTQMKLEGGSSGAKCPPGMKPDAAFGCVSLFKPTPTPTGMQKGNSVYAKLPKLVLFSTPSGNSSFGRLANNIDLSKPIGVYELKSEGDFSKIWLNLNYIKNNGMIGMAPAWAYVYTNLIRK